MVCFGENFGKFWFVCVVGLIWLRSFLLDFKSLLSMRQVSNVSSHFSLSLFFFRTMIFYLYDVGIVFLLLEFTGNK